jgi:hypothetical protein
MAHKKQTPIALDNDGGLRGSGNTLYNAVSDFTEKEWFTLRARAALIGCELHTVHLGHVTLYRLQCLDGAMVLSHPHDVQSAIAARQGGLR